MAAEPEKLPENQQPPTSAPPAALYLHPSTFPYASPPGQAGAPPPPPWPHGMYPPTVLPYPSPVQPGDASDTAVAPIGYVMIPPLPPGMVYAFPPMLPGQPYPYPPPSASAPEPAEPPKPKRKQVKQACSNCAVACKRCDDNRPCARCQKYGIAESCADAVRKERQKGVKRGPYKRRTKESDQPAEQQTPTDWLPGPLEGYPQPYFYPPTPGFFPPPPAPDANAVPAPTAPDGAGASHSPPAAPYYAMPPVPYPFHPYPPPFIPPPVPPSRVETAKDESEKKKRKSKKKADNATNDSATSATTDSVVA